MSGKRDAKKAREKTLLNLIYADEDYAAVVPAEEPDFRIRHKQGDGEFGVEVTEFYHDQSRARISNIPGYIGEILSMGEYRHKDDVAALKLGRFAIVPADDSRPRQELDGVIQAVPTVDQWVDKVADLVSRKNERFADYTAGLDHVNLIVMDRENRLARLPAEDFHTFFFTDMLVKALLDAEFREVHLVTTLGPSESAKRVYIPLKMVFLVAEAYLLNQIMVSEYPTEAHRFNGAALFAEYLRWRGARGVRYAQAPRPYEVVYGNCGLSVSEKSEVRIYDARDGRWPSDLLSPGDSELAGFFNSQFREHHSRLMDTHTFSSQLYFDVRAET
ncbi:MAG: hypothetical protein JXA57_08640 [Armatimonadetes bacterium]|nr:hypothetical protein [Armatimonadota bacterium]